MGTGGRLRYAYKKLNLDEDILMTYGDGVADINIKKLIDFHYKTELLSSMSIVYAPYRYGIVKIKKNLIEGFNNRKKEMINGGFFVISKKAIKYIKKDSQYWESEPLEKIISLKKLGAYKHYGYWGSLDTLKDKKNLNELWFKKKAPWKT